MEVQVHISHTLEGLVFTFEPNPLLLQAYLLPNGMGQDYLSYDTPWSGSIDSSS